MNAQAVAAIVVTYHPNPEMLESLLQIFAQVQEVVIVDNGSNAEALESLRRVSHAPNVHLLENGENLGVAEALNQGIRLAKSKGFPWVILFDQDSRVTDCFVREMFAAWQSSPNRDRVASIHPRYVDALTGVEWRVPRDRRGGPILPMTSGALMPVWIFDRIGWFASEYFIDFLDWEFCFRARAAGYLIADAAHAALVHSPGDPAKRTVLGYTFYPSHHNAIRRYYMSRNGIVFYGKYFRLFPAWVLSSFYGHLKDTVVCLIAEEDRAHKFRNILLGTWDGLRGRMGKRDGL